ncbi:MAG: alpha/beta hydrolase, partial [bacterium]|nr:alpha/beta hydrolase [bacterium]
SLGGAVAIDGALERPVAGLVVQSSFTQLRDMARCVYPEIPLHLIARNEFRSIDKVGRLELPKLFIHGTEDGTVPFAIGEQLYAAAAEPKEWYPVPRAGHNDVDRWGGSRYLRTLTKFFRRAVG